MKKFLITIDSSCDISKEYLDNNDVRLINLDVISDNVVVTNMSNDDLYQKMREGIIFHTSQISPHKYCEFFKSIDNKFNLPIIHISLGSGLSNTYNNALLAKELLKEDDILVEVIDSKIASLGLMVLLDNLLELQNNGIDYLEAKKQIDELALSINTFYTNDDLTYFVRGGRLSKTKAIIGNMLNINPILNCEPDGKLNIHSIVVGKNRAQMHIINLISKSIINPSDQSLYITSACNKQEAIKFAERIIKAIRFKDYIYMDMGPVIGTHTGPGLIALFYKGVKRV